MWQVVKGRFLNNGLNLDDARTYKANESDGANSEATRSQGQEGSFLDELMSVHLTRRLDASDTRLGSSRRIPVQLIVRRHPTVDARAHYERTPLRSIRTIV